MKEEEISIDSYLWNGMQTHHWCANLAEAGCLIKLNRTDEAKVKIDRARHILLNSWKEKDGSADYLAKDPEKYLSSYRKYYSEWNLDTVFPCPI
jgi:hypothetical protein